MDITLLETLLYEEESNALDFKRDQYRFTHASDADKSELLKDVLAFANTWRHADAYILIGVEEVKGGRSVVQGITEHFNDASLQQFVNSKTQRPVQFSYETVSFEGKRIGVIQIPLQDRPIFLSKDFGKIKQHAVYVRRGSSTDIADPDEIARMGNVIGAGKQEELNLEVQFADISSRKELGRKINVESEILIPLPASQIPSYPIRESSQGNMAMVYSVDPFANANYYKELSEYLVITAMLRPLGFVIKNQSAIVAQDVRLELKCFNADDLFIIGGDGYPVVPEKNRQILPSGRVVFPGTITVDCHDDQWAVVAHFGKIQPKATVWSSNVFFIGTKQPLKLNLDGTIYADNLGSPVLVPCLINFTTTGERQLSIEDLVSFTTAEDEDNED